MRRVMAAVALVCALRAPTAAAPDAVRVWEDVLELPTSAEGPPNPNPPFDLFSFTRFNYPYPLRDALTDRRVVQRWRALHLENEYLRVTVLPDLGGHLYSCVDKVERPGLFYANRSIKKALHRLSRRLGGVRHRVQLSRCRTTGCRCRRSTSRSRRNADGSASIWVGNVDPVYGSAVARRAAAASRARACSSRTSRCYNRGDTRHRYYWWSNAAVQVWDDSRLVYPTRSWRLTASRRSSRGRIDEQGRDLSVIRNQTAGRCRCSPTARASRSSASTTRHTSRARSSSPRRRNCRRQRSGPGACDADGAALAATPCRTTTAPTSSCRRAFSATRRRTHSSNPQDTVRFAEYWMPVRDIGGITRATIDAVFHGERGRRGSRVARAERHP